MRTRLLPLATVALMGVVAPFASAGEISKNDGTASLVTASGWAGGVVPTAADTILLNNLTASRTVNVGAASFAVAGINHTSSFQFQLGNATAGSILSIGAGGINKAAGTGALILGSAGNVTLSLAAAQTWTIGSAAGSNLQLNGPLMTNGHALNVIATTNGVLDLRTVGSATLDSNVTIGANVSVNSATANVTVQGANTFDALTIASGRINVSTLGNFGEASAAGDGGTNTAIILGSTNAAATFEYQGASASSNRTFNLDRRANSAALNVANAGTTLTINTVQTSAGSATGEKDQTLSLGGAGNLVIAGAVSDHTSTVNTTSVVVNGTGTVTLAGNNTFAGPLTINSGTARIGDGGTTGAVATNSIVNNSALAFNRSDSALVYSGVISGTGTVANVGTGEVTLSGANTYSGKTAVTAGTLAFDQTAALGTNAALDLGAAGTSSGTLRYVGTSAATLNQNIKSLGNGTDAIQNSSTALLNLAGTLEKNGTVLTLRGGSGGLNVTGVISGALANSDLIIDGGTTTLNAANTYNGPTTITNGANLVAATAGALPTSPRSAVILDPSGSTGGSTLTLGAAQSAASLTGAAGSTVALQTNQLTVGTTGGTTTFAGNLTGTGSLLKDGASTLTLSGVNTYTGITRIDAGTLALGASNTLADTSNVVFYGGALAAGGFTDIVGTLTLQNTAILNFSSGGSLSFADSSTQTWNPSAQLQLVGNWTSLRFGTNANGLTSAQLGQIVALNSSLSDFRLDAGGYVYAAIPEPSTYALLGLGGIMCAWFYRRRRQA